MPTWGVPGGDPLICATIADARPLISDDSLDTIRSSI